MKWPQPDFEIFEITSFISINTAIKALYPFLDIIIRSLLFI